MVHKKVLHKYQGCKPRQFTQETTLPTMCWAVPGTRVPAVSKDNQVPALSGPAAGGESQVHKVTNKQIT